MAGKKKLELEFSVNSTPKVLFNRLSTQTGLSVWFADEVDVDAKNKIYTFSWDGCPQTAELVSKKEGEFIRFRWIDNDEFDEDMFFEFRILQDELTGDISLQIIDFVDEEDMEDMKTIWNRQVSTLCQNIGS